MSCLKTEEKRKYKQYHSKRYNVDTYGLICPCLDGTVGFEGTDRKLYDTVPEDLELIYDPAEEDKKEEELRI